MQTFTFATGREGVSTCFYMNSICFYMFLFQAGWMQNIEKDQGAFDETVLEVLGMEAWSILEQRPQRCLSARPKQEGMKATETTGGHGGPLGATGVTGAMAIESENFTDADVAGYDSECAQYVWPNAKGNHEAGFDLNHSVLVMLMTAEDRRETQLTLQLNCFEVF